MKTKKWAIMKISFYSVTFLFCALWAICEYLGWCSAQPWIYALLIINLAGDCLTSIINAVKELKGNM